MSGFQTNSLNLDLKTSDPGTPDEGEAWYNSADAHLKASVDTGGNKRSVLVTEKRTAEMFNLPSKVPNSGTAWLFIDGIATSSVPYRVIKPHSVLRRISIRVDVADPTRSYAVDVYDVVGATILHSSPLAATNTAAFEDLSLALTGPIELEFRVRRTSGSGASSFKSAWVEVTFGE